MQLAKIFPDLYCEQAERFSDASRCLFTILIRVELRPQALQMPADGEAAPRKWLIRAFDRQSAIALLDDSVGCSRSMSHQFQAMRSFDPSLNSLGD